jgi:cystathionine beta-lyase
VTAGFDDLSLEALRGRRSQKWAAYEADVLPAWVAEMDFPLAPAVRDGLLEAVARGDCGYAHPGRLAEAFAAFAATRFGWELDPGRVWLVPDVVVGIAEVLRLLTAPGDGVLVNPPVYPPFYAVIADGERRLLTAPLVESSEGWQLDLDAVEDAFARGARAYLLCNPHNPTGRVLAVAELEQIAELANRYDAVVISDEIHAPLTLPGATHTPFPMLGDERARRAVTITGASKAWNLAGLKAALVVAGSATMQAELKRLPRELVVHSGHLGVWASISAFDSGGSWLDSLVSYLDGNRRLLEELLSAELPQVRYVPPQAGYLAWLDCRALPLGEDPAASFLERGRVALSSGPRFGEQGRGFARLNFGTSRQLLSEAVRRMAAAFRAGS